MRTNQNKILMIVLIAVAVIAIAGGVLAYLFLATNVFKSGQELFTEYLIQNMAEAKEILTMNKIENIKNELKQSKYEQNMVFSLSEVDNEDSIMELTLDTQNDPINGKIYGMLGLEVPEEDKLNLEFMHEEDLYSLRFTNAVKQFLTIKNSDLKKFAEKLGVTGEDLEAIPDKIDFSTEDLNEINFTEEEKNAEIDKYSKLLYNNIAKEKYQKNRNVVITVNSKTITTNAYVLTLSKQDVETIVLKMLETLNQDEIILSKLEKIDEKLAEYETDSLKDAYLELIQDMTNSLNGEEVTEEDMPEEEKTEESNLIITVYEANKETVRIKLEKDLDFITLDTIRQDAKKQLDLNITTMDEENTQSANKISMVKENDNKLNITFYNIEGEEQQSMNINIEVTEKDNTRKISTILNVEEQQIKLISEIKIVDEIDFKVTLDNSNNIILNNLSLEQIVTIFGQLGERLNTEYVEPLEEVLMPLMMLNSAQDAVGNTNLSGVETQSFNSTFEVYEGKVSTSQVNSLLNTVVNHNRLEDLKDMGERYVTVSGVVTLEEDATEFEKLTGNNYYDVECELDDDGFINEIVITTSTENESTEME